MYVAGEALDALPIDALLAEITRTALAAGALVLEAPPGAGKTTRVPWALAEALGDAGEVVVTEPRRLAARLAAERVAHEHGERPGDRVGYSVRFEEVGGPRTRLRYVTEGVLVRRLLADPDLSGVRAVVIDEFHERHVETDLLLALFAHRRASRGDLVLVVMSATLDAEPIAKFLDGAPRITSEGRLFPVTVEHLATPDERPLDKQVTSAVRRALEREPDGDVLVFLPGAGEIRRAHETLEPLAREHNVLVLPLHGDLPLKEQTRAVERASRRKVVLSTNVAESSITIDGVTSVIDSGLARVAAHSAWSGLGTLTTAKISRASAKQRAGRAGRTRPGHVLCLYTRGDFEHRPENDTPEIARANLSEVLLTLAAAGFAGTDAIAWLSEPPAASRDAARALLRDLGALGQAGELTAIGRRLLELPLHPRLARLVVEGERRGVAEHAALLAALIGERDIRMQARAKLGGGRRERLDGERGPSDPLMLADLFDEAASHRFEAHRVRAIGLEPRSVEAVERARRQLARAVRDRAPRPADEAATERALLACVLAAFPDRVARRRRRGEPELVLENGRLARLAEESVVHDAELFVAVDAEERPGRGTLVRSASAVDENLLFELDPERLELRDDLVFAAERERVERVSSMRWGSLVLEETRAVAPPSVEAGALLFAAARAVPSRFVRSAEALWLTTRLLLLAEHFPDAGFPSAAEEALAAALARASETVVSLEALEASGWLELLPSTLSERQRRLLADEVPETVRLASGRNARVQYEPGRAPFVESRLQDFFGRAEGPRILGGRVPLTLHLLAPNQRAVQVTTDLAGFWQRHYPTVRRELMRRYPRHAWPEDGSTAVPPAPRGR